MKSLRAWRLTTGLVLTLFVTVHLSNHALGLISIDAQEAMRKFVSPIWRSLPGTLLLYSALIVHALLGLYALWRRETLRMPAWEFAQLSLGLAIPLMLIPHIFGTHVAASMLGTETTYAHVIAALWSKTETLIRQPLLVLIVWGHLLVGLHYWLRLRPGYRRLLPVTYLVAAMVPLLALLGFLRVGVELRQTATATSVAAFKASPETNDDADSQLQPGWDDTGTAERRATREKRKAALDERKAALAERKELALDIAGGMLALVLLARMARRGLRTRQGTYRITHANGSVIVAPVGQSLLEALREARIPHASVCGGRARCTTCRVRIGKGRETLPTPNPAEASALRRIHADADTRLACQLRPRHNVIVTPLVPADAGAADANVAGSAGSERALAVMFVDLRDSSGLAEHRLPYDVLFILNRFFAEMADALSETGGYYSTFNGDGFMALYGTTSDLGQGCRDALHGAVAVSRRLAQINAALTSELRDPLRVGISIHAGEAIVGTMGPPANPIISALGDTVNVAARLEAETKRHNCALIVSVACARASGIDLSQFPEHTVDVRGRSQQVSYYAIADVAALTPLLPHATVLARTG